MTEIDTGYLEKLLTDERSDVLARWIAQVTATSRARVTDAELRAEFATMLDALVSGMSSGAFAVSDEGYGELRALLTELSRSRARQGFSPSETATSIFALKDVVLDLSGGEGAVPKTEFIAFSRLLDSLGLLTFEAYSQTRERIILEQSDELRELSTPVVKLWKGIVAIPLVGTLDSARTQIVTEKLLETLVDTGSTQAIIDITGVPAVDTQVAQHLLKTVVAARLMGADCIISGIRPQIAQTIVALGIEFGNVATKASLADALMLALKRIGVVVGAGMA